MKSKILILIISGLFGIITSCNDDEPITNNFKIGQKHEGGIIFYIDDSGQHGLIAAPFDQAYREADWGCHGVDFLGASDTAIGSGLQNTLDIIDALNQSDDCVPNNPAALLCVNLSIDGFSDWYLPSMEELKLMHEHREIIGGFGLDFYWSSSEFNNIWTRVRFFSEIESEFDGDWNAGKRNPHSVRAVRSF